MADESNFLSIGDGWQSVIWALNSHISFVVIIDGQSSDLHTEIFTLTNHVRS